MANKVHQRLRPVQGGSLRHTQTQLLFVGEDHPVREVQLLGAVVRHQLGGAHRAQEVQVHLPPDGVGVHGDSSLLLGLWSGVAALVVVKGQQTQHHTMCDAGVKIPPVELPAQCSREGAVTLHCWVIVHHACAGIESLPVRQQLVHLDAHQCLSTSLLTANLQTDAQCEAAHLHVAVVHQLPDAHHQHALQGSDLRNCSIVRFTAQNREKTAQSAGQQLRHLGACDHSGELLQQPGVSEVRLHLVHHPGLGVAGRGLKMTQYRTVVNPFNCPVCWSDVSIAQAGAVHTGCVHCSACEQVQAQLVAALRRHLLVLVCHQPLLTHI